MTMPGALPFGRSDIEQTIPARFEAVVRTWPDRLALSGDGRTWSYARLNGDANRIAHALLARTPSGAGRIAYLVTHSPDMVLATLAALKAGKTYVAIHPRLPRQAQHDILRDVEPDLLLATRATELEARALAAGTCEVLVVDDVPAESPTSNPRDACTPRDPSTLFYTSGSTGQPKGVVKSHRAVLHRAWLSTQHDRITPDDRQSLLTHCAFSASESDMFGPLLQGAAVCTFDIAAHSLGDFRAWIESERITLLHPPALYFRRFLATLQGTGLFPQVRIVALAGDVVLPADLERWRRHFSHRCRVLHRFSITETALLSVAHIGHGDRATGTVVEAGHPVADKELTLVDGAGQPVAPGEIGELLVTSAFLSDGYWKRPDETVTAFCEAADGSGRRTYRTGDMGRFEPDGSFVFLGRRDHQVKIRGYRVDTREIESAMLRAPGVSEVAVIPWRSGGEQRLRAFVVWRESLGGSGLDLRAALRAWLPEWKLPDDIVPIAVLPTTLTGKVDRRALADVVVADGDHGAPAPAVPVADASAATLEGAVRATFANVLKRPSFPPGGHFLEHGGNSLLMAELQIALHARFGVELPLHALVREPTVEATVVLIRGAGAGAGVSRLTADEEAGGLVLLRQGPLPPLFLVHGGSGVPPSSTPLLDALGEDAAVIAFRARGFDRGERPFTSVSEMADAYLAAMRRRQPAGPYALGAICAGSTVAIEMARRLRAEGELVGPLLLFDPPLPPRMRPAMSSLWRRLVLLVLPSLHRVRPVAALVARRFSGSERTPEELRVWLAFRRASFRYRPVPYDGPVIVFGSRERNRHFHAGRWRSYLSGTVELSELGARHRDALDAITAEGRLAVQHAVRIILRHTPRGFPANAAENSPRSGAGFP